MLANKVATRYASAILGESIRLDILDSTYTDMKLIRQGLDDSRELALLLKSPIINSGIKKSVMLSIFSEKVSELTRKFLVLLVDKGREGYISDIIDAFFSAFNKLKNIKEVALISAVPLEEGIESNILSIVKNQLGASSLEVKKSVDPSLLGGFVIKIDDKVFDTSLHNKLSALRRQLLAG